MSRLDLAAAVAGARPDADTEPKPNGRLNAQPRWNDTLQALRSDIIQSDEYGLPRFGVLSILARRVPFHLYDHPALVALCDSAFTDGVHVFVHTGFLAEVMETDRVATADGGLRHSMVLVLLHELCHILYRHHRRIPPHAPPLLWAIACDISINARLLTAYPRLRPGPVFDDAWGARPEERDRYLGQSEEHIVNGLWEAPEPEQRDVVEALKKALDSGGGGVTPALDARGAPQDVHGHLVQPETLARTLEDAGLQHVRRALALPEPGDAPAFEQLAWLGELKLSADFDRARELSEQHPKGAAMAGAHMEESWSEWVDADRFGQLTWRNLLRDLVLGDGMAYEHCDEVPSELYFVEPAQMGLDAPLYIGSPAPAGPSGVVLCIVDTSLSVSVDALASFIAELKSLIEQGTVRPEQLYLVSADSTLRSEVEMYSAHELSATPEQLLLQGRGGTDITRVLNEALDASQRTSEFAGGTLEAIVYFTDLVDRPPDRAALPDSLPKLLFLSPPTAAAPRFRQAVADFAMVAEIRDGTVIDPCPG